MSGGGSLRARVKESDCSCSHREGIWGSRGNWFAEPQQWDSPVSEGRWKAGNRKRRRGAGGNRRVWI